ncbi:DUF4276 family protein [Comamonas sp. AG1104]|uniref:DUF4276 family protein n=1 Tax=Comamonas sp. AG1104 TaxID=2183900 RepID=UPI000E0B39CC|nr:DUF4276 family protein [Comamonas sp. AG1104]RDI10754.1 uncharacterized protein DUF4276 [Comamonas sp. AG1104]
MTRVYILVEGQTEEIFVNECLAPYYLRQQKYLYPIIVSTSPGHKGGVSKYAKIKPQIDRLCRQHGNAYVTTIFDLYGLPVDFPGKNHPTFQFKRNGNDKADLIEQEWSLDIGKNNFIPNIIVHEFEALLFVNLEVFTQWTDDDSVIDPLSRVREDKEPEDINDSPITAPSKRIISAMPNYQKTFHGPLIAAEIGIDAMRQSCPHFDAWLNKIDELPSGV